MNKQTGIIVGIVIAVVAVFGAAAALHKNEAQRTTAVAVDAPSAMMDKDGAAMMDNKMEPKMEDKMMAAGSYEAYAPEKLARAEAGDVVLFFHASWCPTCHALNADIEQNAGSIPAGVTILKTDYDTETALKQKYGVTFQHTLVQVDKDGNMLKKWSGSPSLGKLLAEIQ